MMEKLTICQRGGSYPDPHFWVEPRSHLSIRFNVFEGLVTYDADLNVVPLLAESWTVSEDAKDWVFTLRKGVRYHDGTPVTAADAAASIRNASRKDVPGAYGTDALLYAYLGGAEVAALDEERVRIILPEPIADLPELLVFIMIIPERCIGAAPETVPGTGPFRYGSIDGNRYTFFRNEHYWKGAPDLKELVFVDEKDPKRRVEALMNGDADIITYMDGSHMTEVEKDENLCVIEYDTPVSIPLFLNCFSGPFADVRVRQAVNYATDVREIIEKAAGGAAVPLTGPLSRFHFGFDPHSKPYPYDTKKAWELLAEAGYSDGLELTMYRPTSSPNESAAIAKCIREQWARVGIKVHEVVQEDREQYALDVRDKKIRDFCIFDSSPVSTYRVLHEKLDSSYHGPWWQGFDSPEFNALMAKAASTTDTAERKLIYRQALRTAAEEAAWVFLYSPVEFYGAKWEVVDQFPGLFRRADGVILVN